MLTNRQLLLPYILPYMLYVGIASLPGDLLGREFSYVLRICAVTLALLWARRWYCRLTGPGSVGMSVLVGLGAGLAGTWLWIVLLAPFVPAADASDWSPAACVLRVAAAGFLVPIFEELTMRGFIFRLAMQWDAARKAGQSMPLQHALDACSVNDVQAGAWSWAAVGISTLVFTAGHAVPEWPASVAYGLLMAGLWIWRRDLLSCIIAHGVTNIALAAYVFLTGNWQFW